MHRVAILIVTYNGANHLPSCLSSLENQTYNNFDVIIYDNASTDETRSIVSKAKNVKRAIYSDVNKGFTGGNNNAIKTIQDSYDYIVLLNQDTRCHTTWLEYLVESAEKSDADIISCNVRPLREYPTPPDYGMPIWFVPQIPALVYGEPTKNSVECNFAAGTACLIKLENISKLPYIFDERFFMYHEDIDLSVRVIGLGGKILFEPRSLAWHNDKVKEGAPFYVVRNLHWLVYKNFGINLYLKFLFRIMTFSLRSFQRLKANQNYLLPILHATLDAWKKIKLFNGETLNSVEQRRFFNSVPTSMLNKIIYEIKNGTMNSIIFHA